MEFFCYAADASDREIKLIVEPWADEIALPDDGLILRVDGEGAEPMEIKWFPDAVMVWPPRYTTLTVFTRKGDELCQFDTREIPELPVSPRLWTQ
jgi:hypothetical protein